MQDRLNALQLELVFGWIKEYHWWEDEVIGVIGKVKINSTRQEIVETKWSSKQKHTSISKEVIYGTENDPPSEIDHETRIWVVYTPQEMCILIVFIDTYVKNVCGLWCGCQIWLKMFFGGNMTWLVFGCKLVCCYCGDLNTKLCRRPWPSEDTLIHWIFFLEFLVYKQRWSLEASS